MSDNQLPTAFNCELFGGAAIYRPSHDSEWAVRREAEASLRGQFKAGTYNTITEINEILQRHFSFYDEMLKQLAPRIASRHVMEFVLTQYDLSVEVDRKCGRGQVIDLEELARWRELGPDFRRATKYLAECIAMLSPDEAPDADPGQVIGLIDRCWICAEQMVHLSTLSTQTFALFPDQTTLEIRPEGEFEWFILRLDDPSRFKAFGERSRRDTASRKNVIDEPAMIYNQGRLKEVLDERFKASCGFSMTDVFQFGFSLNKNTVQPEPGFDIPYEFTGSSVQNPGGL